VPAIERIVAAGDALAHVERGESRRGARRPRPRRRRRAPRVARISLARIARHGLPGT